MSASICGLLEGNMKDELKEKIALRAYELYMARGGKGGSAIDDWGRAEKEILAEDKKGSAKKMTVIKKK
jgi:hypothetical protein